MEFQFFNVFPGLWNVPFCCFFVCFLKSFPDLVFMCLCEGTTFNPTVQNKPLCWSCTAGESEGWKINWSKNLGQHWSKEMEATRQRRAFTWDILRGCIYSLTNQEVSPWEPHRLFRCLKSRNYFMGERGRLGWMRRQRKHIEPWCISAQGAKALLWKQSKFRAHTQVLCRVLTVCQRKPRLFSGCMKGGKGKEHEKNCDSVAVRKKPRARGSVWDCLNRQKFSNKH